MVGENLGHYEILEPLGAGGMGRVYRARDRKLDRVVAIKVLPDGFAEDYGNRTRFQQEAKLLATINHPNVAAVYDLDSHDDVWYLAQEYIEGQSLATLLRFGRLGVEEALTLARQIAAGLEAVHAKGIVHRDLKPSNVMVTADNEAKLLDFGIATPLEVDTAAPSPGSAGSSEGVPDPAETPTYSSDRRREFIVGTVGYMSPEQARRRSVDNRSDIWAFGCVLYETLAGRRAFEGDTTLDKLAHTVRGEVDWSALPDETPARIRTLLRHCLQKDRDRRLQHIGDARIEIDEVLEGTEPDAVAAPSRTKLPSGAPSSVVPWLVALAAVALAAATWWDTRGREEPPPRPVSVAVYPAGGETLVARPSRPFVISPDGRTLVYVAIDAGDVNAPMQMRRRRLYRRDMGSFASVPIAGTEGADYPFFSPDGQWIGFFSTDDNKLKKVALGGGGVVEICSVQATSGGASWGPDDRIAFATIGSATGLMIVDAEGGEPEQLTRFDPEGGDRQHGWPQYLPDGWLLYTLQSQDGRELRVLDPDTGASRPVPPAQGLAQYVDTGHLVYADAGQLLAAPFDLETHQVTGSPISMLAPLYVATGNGFAYFSISRDGILVYVEGPTGEEQRKLVWVERSGGSEPIEAPPAAYNWPTISPDGTQIAVSESVGNGSDIWLIDVRRGVRTRVTHDGLSNLAIWSPSGDALAFASRAAGAADIYVSRLEADDGAELMLTSPLAQWPRSWSPDGTTLAYYEMSPETQRDIYTFDIETEESRPFLVTEFNERAPVFSPDGRWIAYVSNETGHDEVYVRPYPGPGGGERISTEGGTEPTWNPPGDELFYRADRWMMAVDFEGGGETPLIDPPRPLFEGDHAADPFTGNQNYDVAPDGRFLMIDLAGENAPRRFNVVVNWTATLRELTSGQ